ncbi:MAG: DsbC family protein [Betaproteobacteria bacterium]|nr:DsbC family protein [Betaproteobacteria bacterium]
MNRVIAMVLGVFLATIGLSVVAQTTGAEAGIKKRLEERMPGVRIAGVTKTQFGGLFEVRTEDHELIYVDDKVTFLIDGSILDGNDPRRNYTQERLKQLVGFKYDELPFGSAFKIVRGNGKRQMAYFSDPNCLYCRKLDAEIAQMNDVTVHVFLYPILSAESVPKAKAVWCSPDRSKAWVDLMLKNTSPGAAGTCDTPIEQLLALGRKHKVDGVPTLVFANGDRVSGLRSATQLSQMIDVAALKK